MVLKTLMKSIRQYKKQSIASPVFVSIEVIMECILPLIMAKVIDSMNGNSMGPILKYGLILVIFAMISLFFGVMAGKEAATASCGFAKNLRQDMYFKIQDFAFADIDKFSSSSLVTRMTTDVTNVQNAYQMLIRAAMRTPLMIIFSVIMSMTINPRMACIFLVLIPILGVALFGIALYQKKMGMSTRHSHFFQIYFSVFIHFLARMHSTIVITISGSVFPSGISTFIRIR